MMLGDGLHVYLSPQALQLKPLSVEMSCDKCVFRSSAAFGSKKKSCTASLKRLVGVQLEGLEIEWTTSALGRYLRLSRAPAGCSPQQNAALGCVKAAQTAAHPLSGLISPPRMGPLGPGGFWTDQGVSTPESGTAAEREGLAAARLFSVSLLLRLYRVINSQWNRVGSCKWLITVWPVKSNGSWRVTLGPRALSSPALSGDGTPEAPLSDGWQGGWLCSPGRTSLVNDRNQPDEAVWGQSQARWLLPQLSRRCFKMKPADLFLWPNIICFWCL